MHRPGVTCWTVEVMTRVVAGVVGVGGAGVVHRKREPGRNGPGSSRFTLVTASCQDGQPSTAVCSFQTVLSGALISVSVR